jgi:hypothetical protein
MLLCLVYSNLSKEINNNCEYFKSISAVHKKISPREIFVLKVTEYGVLWGFIVFLFKIQFPKQLQTLFRLPPNSLQTSRPCNAAPK